MKHAFHSELNKLKGRDIMTTKRKYDKKNEDISNNLDTNLSLIGLDETNKFDEQTTITFDDGKTLKCDVEFSPIKLNLLSTEFMEVIKESNENSYSINTDISLAIIMALVVKHFTSIQTDANGYNGLIKMFNQLSKNNYLDKILEIFPTNNIESLFDHLKVLGNMLSEEVQKIKKGNQE